MYAYHYKCKEDDVHAYLKEINTTSAYIKALNSSVIIIINRLIID